MERLYSPTLMVLIALLLVAFASDVKTRRIPNKLILVGIALGFLFQLVGENYIIDGDFFALSFGAHGLKAALLGGLTGLGLFLPFYILRTLGAGDVKLFAVVGIFLGPQHTLWAALWTMIAGGVLALAFALCSGVLRQVISNIHAMFITSMMQAQTGGGIQMMPPVKTTGRLPYAVAITCGTAFEIARVLF